MSGISLGGLVSGMDTDSVISKLMEIEAMRVRTQESKKATIVAKQNAWKSVESSLSTLKSKLDAIRYSSLFSSRKATLSDDTVASVTVSSGATAVTHDLQVSKLAQTHVVGSANYSSPNKGLGITGPLTIGTGTVQVDSSDTLYSLRDKINGNADTGVKADVVTVMQGATSYYRLVLTAKQQGTVGEIHMSGPAGIFSSNAAIADASGVTAAGPYQIDVTRTAQASFTTRDSSTLGAGSDFTGTFRINGTDITVGTNTAQDFVDSVNAAGAGVTASLVTDATGDHIRLVGDGGTSFTVDSDDGTLEGLGLVVPATYTVNGTAYKSLTNSVTDAAGVAGLNLNLSQTGTARVGGFLQVLGFDKGTGLNNISQAQDAEFKLNGMDYRTSTNVVSGVLPGVSITLKKDGNTTISIGQDEDKVVTAVQGFVDALNSTQQLLTDLTKYNESSKTGGTLNGDPTARRLQTALKGMLSYTVTGAAGDFDQLSDVGVKTGAYNTADFGKVVFDSTKLKEKLAADPDAVAKIFGALRDNVARRSTISVTGGSTTALSDIVNGDKDISRAGTPGGGWDGGAGNTPTITLDFAAITRIDQVQLTIPDSDGTTGMKDFKLSYQDSNGAWQTIEDVTSHKGSSRLFEFQPVTAKAIKLEVKSTYAGSAARVTELEVMAENPGVGSAMYNYVKGSLATETGTIAVRKDTFDKQIKDINTQIERMNDRMTKQEAALRAQFSRMEQMMAKLQAQSGAFSSQIAGLSGQSGK